MFNEVKNKSFLLEINSGFNLRLLEKRPRKRQYFRSPDPFTVRGEREKGEEFYSVCRSERTLNCDDEKNKEPVFLLGGGKKDQKKPEARTAPSNKEV